MENQNRQPQRERIAAVDGEDEVDEETTMEVFYALVRNFKEMRDRRRKELMIGDEAAAAAAEKKRKRMKTTTEEAEVVQNRSTWIPRFEREDFDEDFQVRGPIATTVVLPKPCNLVKKETAETTTEMRKKKKNMIKSGDDCLDLKLGL